ncbi:MAG: MFS transporter [Planctomycetaceae bacterium]|jgi:MFS family permease|nr:MFS transporter [Planctomycetaceae bacterium]
MIYKWELVGLLWLAYFFNQADRAIYNVVLPQLKTELGLSDIQAGLVASIFLWTYAIFVPIAGWLGDIFHRKSIIFGSLLFWSAATITSGFSSGLFMLIVFRSLATGGGEAFYYPAANSLISQYHHKTRALAMSIHQTSLYVGIITSGLISGWIAEQFGWRMAFFVFGSFGVLLATLIFWRIRNEMPPNKESNFEIATENINKQQKRTISFSETLRSILRTPSVWAIWITFATANFVFLGYLTWTPTFLYEKFHQSLTVSGFSSMFYHHLFAFIGVLLGGKFSDRFAGQRIGVRLEIQILGLFFCAPFVLLLALSPNIIGCYIGLAGFGFFRGIYESNLFASLFDVVESRYRATAVGLMLSVGFIFSAFSPIMMGWSKLQFGISFTFAILAPILLISATIFIITRICWLKRDYISEESQH